MTDVADLVTSVIIPAFGPAALLAACLQAIAEAERPYEVLVWDNGFHGTCPLGAYAMLGSEGNLGFAVACNRAAEAANGNVLVLLNCDTEPQRGWLTGLLEAFEDPDVAIAGSRLVHPDGTLQHAGIAITLNGFVQPDEIKADLETRDVDAVTGACLAIRRSVWEQLGGFDEGYINGNEDVDLCIRARRAGHRVRYVRESLVMHHESATGPERWAHWAQNVERLQQWAVR